MKAHRMYQVFISEGGGAATELNLGAPSLSVLNKQLDAIMSQDGRRLARVSDTGVEVAEMAIVTVLADGELVQNRVYVGA